MADNAIDLSDRNAWDDSALVNSWNEALAEYNVRLSSPPVQTNLYRNTTASTFKGRSYPKC